MVFLGADFWTHTLPVFPLAMALAESGSTGPAGPRRAMLHRCDTWGEALDFVVSHPPVSLRGTPAGGPSHSTSHTTISSGANDTNSTAHAAAPIQAAHPALPNPGPVLDVAAGAHSLTAAATDPPSLATAGALPTDALLGSTVGPASMNLTTGDSNEVGCLMWCHQAGGRPLS